MPDFWTHILGGELILTELKNNRWQKIIKQERNLYNLGCQGPDFFYYNDFWPWIKDKRGPQIGSKLHQENIKSFFITSLEYLKNNKENAHFNQLAAYLTGFITHYALDKTTHPFINARTEVFRNHKLLELNLDTYLIRRFWNKKAYKLSPVSFIDVGQDLPSIIEEYYQTILKTTYNYNQSFEVINDSYRDFKRVFNLFYSPYRIKRKIFKLLNYLLTIDISILIYPNNQDYELLAGIEYQEFESLLMKAITEGNKLITLMIDYFNNKINHKKLAKNIPNLSFNGKLV